MKGVHLMEFGIPEAMWHLRVKDFAAIVTMDAHGNSLHADVEKRDRRSAGGVADEVSALPRRVSGKLMISRPGSSAGRAQP